MPQLSHYSLVDPRTIHRRESTLDKSSILRLFRVRRTFFTGGLLRDGARRRRLEGTRACLRLIQSCAYGPWTRPRQDLLALSMQEQLGAAEVRIR